MTKRPFLQRLRQVKEAREAVRSRLTVLVEQVPGDSAKKGLHVLLQVGWPMSLEFFCVPRVTVVNRWEDTGFMDGDAHSGGPGIQLSQGLRRRVGCGEVRHTAARLTGRTLESGLESPTAHVRRAVIAVLLCAQHNHASESGGVEEAQGEAGPASERGFLRELALADPVRAGALALRASCDVDSIVIRVGADLCQYLAPGLVQGGREEAHVMGKGQVEDAGM